MLSRISSLTLILGGRASRWKETPEEFGILVVELVLHLGEMVNLLLKGIAFPS